MSISLLPLEITDAIVDHFVDDFSMLRALAATSPQFRERAQRILFHDITVTYGSKTGVSWVRPILEDERIAGFVQHLVLAGNGSSSTDSVYGLLYEWKDWCRLRSLTLERIDIPTLVFESICGLASERTMDLSLVACKWTEEVYNPPAVLLLTSFHYEPFFQRYTKTFDHPQVAASILQTSSATIRKISLGGRVSPKVLAKIPKMKFPHLETLISFIPSNDLRLKFIADMLYSHPSIKTLEEYDQDEEIYSRRQYRDYENNNQDTSISISIHAAPLLSSITAPAKTIAAIAPYRSIENVTLLTALQHKEPPLSSYLVPALVKSRQAIKRLVLAGSSAHNLEGLQQIIEQNQNLVEFRAMVTDTDCKQIIESLGTLKELQHLVILVTSRHERTIKRVEFTQKGRELAEDALSRLSFACPSLEELEWVHTLGCFKAWKLENDFRTTVVNGKKYSGEWSIQSGKSWYGKTIWPSRAISQYYMFD